MLLFVSNDKKWLAEQDVSFGQDTILHCEACRSYFNCTGKCDIFKIDSFA